MNATSTNRHLPMTVISWIAAALCAGLLYSPAWSAELAVGPRPVIFRPDYTGSRPPLALSLQRLLQHDTRRLAGGRLVDVTVWRPAADTQTTDVAFTLSGTRFELRVTNLPGPPAPGTIVVDGVSGDQFVPGVRTAAAQLVALVAGAPLPAPNPERVPHAALAEFEEGLALGTSKAEDLIRRRAHFAKSAQLAPAWPLAHLELGKTIRDQGDTPGAIEHLALACQLDPADPEAHAELALAYRRGGRLAEAISHYSRALELSPSDPEVHNNFGAALLSAREPDAAVMHFNKAIEIEPRYPEPLVNLGNVFRSRGEHKQAERLYRRAIGLAPDAPAPRMTLAEMLTDIGDHRGAQQVLEPAVAANPDHPAARLQLALVLATRQKYRAAIEHLNTVLRLAPHYREASYNLGLCYHYMGDNKQAEKTFEEAIGHDPDYAWLYYGLGVVYESQEKNRLAQEAMTMALEKDPGLEPARAALSRLRGETPGPSLAWPWGMWCNEKSSTHTASALPAFLTLAGLFLPASLFRFRRRRNGQK